MTTTDDGLDDLLDDLPVETPISVKGKAVPLKRTPAQREAAAKIEAERRAKVELAQANTVASAQAAQLAQIVNLHIAGHSLAAIGAQIGASEAEVDRMLSNEAARYVRNQPQLRTYVRNYISGKYSNLLEAVWDQAVDKTHSQQLEYFDRAQRVLAQMGRLHGAEAPTQTEVKVEAAPESIERVIAALAAGEGMGYDDAIFDIAPEDIHEAVIVADRNTEVSGNAVGELGPGESDDGF